MEIGVGKMNLSTLERFRMNEKVTKRLRMLAFAYCTVILVLCLDPKRAFAERSLTDLFKTTAFSGSWEVFSKFNWLGSFLNFIISSFCLLGLVLTVIRFTITLVYKSNENLFDRVYDLKASGRGTKFFGIPTMAKELFSGNYGTGVDVVLGFILSLLPDFKRASDYNPEKMLYNLKEDDTITTYVLKTALPTIMTIFFFTIGFNGTLWQVYGNVVDAMGKVAERAATVNLAAFVNKALNAGAYYQFSFDTDSPFGSFQQGIAKDIYNQMLLRMDSITTSEMQTVGSNIQKWVAGNITIDGVDHVLNTEKTAKTIKSDETATKNLSYNVLINSNSTANSAGKHVEKVANIVKFGVTAKGAQYVHVIITKKEAADETDYFAVPSNNNSNTQEKPSDKKLN